MAMAVHHVGTPFLSRTSFRTDFSTVKER
jgi:hypothetical protein